MFFKDLLVNLLRACSTTFGIHLYLEADFGVRLQISLVARQLVWVSCSCAPTCAVSFIKGAIQVSMLVSTNCWNIGTLCCFCFKDQTVWYICWMERLIIHFEGLRTPYAVFFFALCKRSTMCLRWLFWYPTWRGSNLVVPCRFTP